MWLDLSHLSPPHESEKAAAWKPRGELSPEIEPCKNLDLGSLILWNFEGIIYITIYLVYGILLQQFEEANMPWCHDGHA